MTIDPNNLAPHKPSEKKICEPPLMDVEGLYKKWSRTSSLSWEKKIFIKKINETVYGENLELLALRGKISRLLSSGHSTPQERLFLRDLMKTYRVKKPQDLISAIDVIPQSLAIAQAILESGWGKSRPGRRHNYFGLIKGRRLLAFSNMKESVSVYALNYNRQSVFKGFRQKRQGLRHQNQCALKGSLLTPCLKGYCMSSSYPSRLCSIIKKYRLDALDNVYPQKLDGFTSPFKNDSQKKEEKKPRPVPKKMTKKIEKRRPSQSLLKK